jgi:hypothetical protein
MSAHVMSTVSTWVLNAVPAGFVITSDGIGNMYCYDDNIKENEMGGVPYRGTPWRSLSRSKPVLHQWSFSLPSHAIGLKQYRQIINESI